MSNPIESQTPSPKRTDIPRGAMVRSGDGAAGTVVSEAGPTGKTVFVRLDDGRQVIVPVDFFEVGADGVPSFPLPPAAQSAGEQRGAAESQPGIVPVIAEELEVGKREVVVGGVRVTKKVVEHEEMIDVPLARDRLVVERVPLHQTVPSDALPTMRQEGDTLVVPLLQEVIVVEKRFVLTEEVRLTRLREEAHAPQTVVLKREEVSIERIDERGQPSGRDER